MAGESSSSPVMVEELTLTVKWSGKEYTISVCGNDTVEELKRRISEVTNVLPKRQKLLCPKVSSKLADHNLLLSQIPLKSSLKLTMIGTIEDGIFADQLESPDIIDDFELGQDEVVRTKDTELDEQKLRRDTEQLKVELQNVQVELQNSRVELQNTLYTLVHTLAQLAVTLALSELLDAEEKRLRVGLEELKKQLEARKKKLEVRKMRKKKRAAVKPPLPVNNSSNSAAPTASSKVTTGLDHIGPQDDSDPFEATDA